MTIKTPKTPKQTHRIADGEDSRSTLGPSRTITVRLPLSLYKKLQRIARSVYQPDPVIFRAAVQEYVTRHRPRTGLNSGIHLLWPDELRVSAEVTQPETPLTPAAAPRSEE